MKKRVIAGVILATILGATTLSAKCMDSGKKAMSHPHKDRVLKVVDMLDLTPTQRGKIVEIKEKYRTQKNSEFLSLFGEKEFDKEKFVKMGVEKKEQMLKTKAEMISEVYALLNDVQKANLKKNLQNSEMNRDFKGKGCDKNSYGGR